MKRLFSAASSVFLGAQARMGGNTGSGGYGGGQDMSAQVDFQTFDIDGQVHDLMWCGAQDEVVLLHTAEGTIYRSRDRGLSWKRLRALLSQTGLGVADEDHEVRSRAACRQSGRPTQ